MTTHQKGYIGETVVRLAAITHGWNVAVPEVEARYDLILDDGNRLYRVQVKYVGEVRNGAVYVDLRKQCRSNGKMKVYVRSEIDAAILYCPRTSALYWIPSDLFHGAHTLSFRLAEAKNRQEARTRLLSNFYWLPSSIPEHSALTR